MIGRSASRTIPAWTHDGTGSRSNRTILRHITSAAAVIAALIVNQAIAPSIGGSFMRG